MSPARRPRSRLRPRPLVVGALVALACVVGFWELAEDLANSQVIAAFDTGVSAAVISLRTPPLTALMLSVTATGGTVIVFVLTASLVVYLLRRRHEFAISALIAIVGGAIAANLLKDRFGRVRPAAQSALIALPESFSFPSGHSMSSLCLAGVAGYIAMRSAMGPAAKTITLVGLVVWAVSVGFSRVYLGVHWPSDVLASWFLGIGWLALLIGYAEARREVPQR